MKSAVCKGEGLLSDVWRLCIVTWRNSVHAFQSAPANLFTRDGRVTQPDGRAEEEPLSVLVKPPTHLVWNRDGSSFPFWGYTAFLSSPHRAQRPYHMNSLHRPGRIVTAAVRRTAIKQSHGWSQCCRSEMFIGDSPWQKQIDSFTKKECDWLITNTFGYDIIS